MSAKRARKSKNEFDESMKRKSVAETSPAGNGYEFVTSYPFTGISTTRMTSVNPQPASGRVITWDDTEFAIGVCYFDEQLQYLQIYDIWATRSPYTCRDYPYMSITIRKLSNAEITPSEIVDVRLMLADTVLPYEPYGATFFDVPCAVKRYASRKETNTSVWQKTYKGNTLIKNGADIALRINTSGGAGASVSTDQFYKDNCAIKLAANETYSINATNNISIGNANVVVRYLDTNEIITSVRYGEQPEDIMLTPNVETYIYFGVDISTGVAAYEKTAKINVIRQSAWHDTNVYVRENGVWVTEATISGVLPLTAVKTTGEDTLDYKIYGASGGVGDNTINLCDGYFINGGGYWGASDSSTKRCMAVNLIVVEPLTTYTFAWTNNNLRYAIQQYGSTEKDLSINPLIKDSSWRTGTSYSFTTEQNTHYIWLQFSSVGYVDDVFPDDTKINLVAGSTAPASYVPYGYEMDMSVSDGTTSTTTPIYIGLDPLEANEYVDYGEGKIYRMSGGVLTPTDPPVPLPALPTFSNTDTIIDYKGTLAPSNTEIKYKRRW